MNMQDFSGKAFPVYLSLAIIILLHCPLSFAYEGEIKDISAKMAGEIANAGRKTIAWIPMESSFPNNENGKSEYQAVF